MVVTDLGVIRISTFAMMCVRTLMSRRQYWNDALRFRDARRPLSVYSRETRRRIFKRNVLDDENDERWGEYVHGVSRGLRDPNAATRYVSGVRKASWP